MPVEPPKEEKVAAVKVTKKVSPTTKKFSGQGPVQQPGTKPAAKIEEEKPKLISKKKQEQMDKKALENLKKSNEIMRGQVDDQIQKMLTVREEFTRVQADFDEMKEIFRKMKQIQLADIPLADKDVTFD